MNKMVKTLAKCPKCRASKEVKRILGSESVEGSCDNCDILFVTASWWTAR